MDRLGLIKFLMEKNNTKKFLEIGVHQGYIIDNIKCEYKVGVDPNTSTRATVFETSDTFFSHNNEKFDLIFIDGLHHSDQVLKDIYNSLQFLNTSGYIVCHDMNPQEEIIQRVPQETGIWTGDCWKAWVSVRSKRPDLKMFVVDIDYGCGVITFGNQELINIDCELNWSNFVANREKWLNLIPLNKLEEYL